MGWNVYVTYKPVDEPIWFFVAPKHWNGAVGRMVLSEEIWVDTKQEHDWYPQPITNWTVDNINWSTEYKPQWAATS